MQIPVKVLSAAKIVGRVVYKNLPKIMVAGGAVASIAAVVEGVKATPKAIEVIEEHKEMVEKIKEARDLNTEEYGPKEYKRDMASQYIRTAGSLGKTFSKAIALELLALTLFGGAVHFYEKQLKVMVSTLAATVDAAMADRQKVVDALGQEEADRIFGGIKEEVVEKEVINEKGKKKKVKDKVQLADPNCSDYSSFLWTQNDYNWDPIPEYREAHIRDVADTITHKIWGEKDDFGNYLIKPIKNFRASMNDIRKWFFYPESKEFWKQECQVTGFDESNPDGEVKPRWEYVSIEDPDHPGNPMYYIDAMRIYWNSTGSICPELIK